MLKALACRLRGHRFRVKSLGKRRCDRCQHEEWLMSRPYPKIGEAKYFWRDMRFGRDKL